MTEVMEPRSLKSVLKDVKIFLETIQQEQPAPAPEPVKEDAQNESSQAGTQ